jgi:hypothetical protein
MERLIEPAREKGSVFLVGHGGMNLLIAGQVSASGQVCRVMEYPISTRVQRKL